MTILFVLYLLISSVYVDALLPGCTDLVLPFNGEDVGWRVGVGLGAFNSAAWVPSFPQEADFETDSNSSVFIQFHPTTRYRSNVGANADDTYWLHVGLISPYTAWNGFCAVADTLKARDRVTYADLLDSGEVHFKGQFRILRESGSAMEINSAMQFRIGATIGHYSKNDTCELITELVDVASPNSVALSLSTDYDCEAWWNTLTWSDWWRTDVYPSSGMDTWGDWVLFDINLTQALMRATELASHCQSPQHVFSDATRLLDLHVGIYLKVGETISFEVQNLQLITKGDALSVHTTVTVGVTQNEPSCENSSIPFTIPTPPIIVDVKPLPGPSHMVPTPAVNADSKSGAPQTSSSNPVNKSTNPSFVGIISGVVTFIVVVAVIAGIMIWLWVRKNRRYKMDSDQQIVANAREHMPPM